MAMELCYRYSNDKQKEIGAKIGVDYSTVSQNRVCLKTKLESNRILKKQYDRILIQIENVKFKDLTPFSLISLYLPHLFLLLCVI